MLKLGLIGCGKMGGALLRGVEKKLGASGLSLALSDVVPAAVEALRKDLKSASLAAEPHDVAAHADVVILAVKPADMKPLCEKLAKVKGSRLYLSIAAGLKLADLSFDGDSLVRDYQNQFSRIVTKDGAEGLLKKLDQRRATLEAEAKGK